MPRSRDDMARSRTHAPATASWGSGVPAQRHRPSCLGERTEWLSRPRGTATREANWAPLPPAPSDWPGSDHRLRLDSANCHSPRLDTRKHISL